MGMDASASMTRIETCFSIRYPYIIARVVRDSRERIPLHAWATSKGIAGRLITLPSRNTGTPKTGKLQAASFEAKICNGKVIWLKTMARIGTIRIRRRSGNRIARSMSQPIKKMINPAKSTINDTRERNSSAPKTPKINMDKENKMIGSPHVEGEYKEAVRKIRIVPPLLY